MGCWTSTSCQNNFCAPLHRFFKSFGLYKTDDHHCPRGYCLIWYFNGGGARKQGKKKFLPQVMHTNLNVSVWIYVQLKLILELNRELKVVFLFCPTLMALREIVTKLSLLISLHGQEFFIYLMTLRTSFKQMYFKWNCFFFFFDWMKCYIYVLVEAEWQWCRLGWMVGVQGADLSHQRPGLASRVPLVGRFRQQNHFV